MDRERKLFGIGIALTVVLTFPFISVIDMNRLIQNQTFSIKYIYFVWAFSIAIVAFVINFKSKKRL